MDKTKIEPIIEVECDKCDTKVDSFEYNYDTDECNACHDTVDFDECGCERCFDRQISKADALYDSMKEDGY